MSIFSGRLSLPEKVVQLTVQQTIQYKLMLLVLFDLVFTRQVSSVVVLVIRDRGSY